jgi:glycosyltransferase involved in cell wall biosynthesis
MTSISSEWQSMKGTNLANHSEVSVEEVILSVTVFAHNPRPDYLQRVLDALRSQTLSKERWELILVDNASREKLAARFDLSWHPNGRIVRNDIPEEESSLTGARMRGVAEARGKWVIFVDDDNVLAPNYLESVLEIDRRSPQLGTFSGAIALQYEDAAKAVPRQLEHLLCKREPAAPIWSNDVNHHISTPWGAGMCVRREIGLAYAEKLKAEPERGRLDPTGSGMMFGGDTDIAYLGCAMGFAKGVYPELKLTHLIPARRCTMEYLLKNLEAHSYSSMLHAWVNTGRVLPLRRDLKGKISSAVRWLFMTRLERQCAAAYRRGLNRAIRDLPPKITVRSANMPQQPAES